jgi:hypothetical protein
MRQQKEERGRGPTKTRRVRQDYYDRPLWFSDEYSDFRGIAPQSARLERMKGGGCPFIRIGARVYYQRQDVFDFVAAHRRTNTAAGAAG